MDNLSTTSITDITSMIGALELGDHLESHGDSALESAGTYLNPLPQPTQMHSCILTFVCRIDDGALEAAGGNMALMCGPPVTQYPFCPRIGDDALEAAGANEAQPTGLICNTQPAMCGY
jgi:hypothetical protein